MKKKILVCTAWPYANNSLHLGHIAGAYLPADIFARYHRMKGNDVLMVSGSDAHGTPVTISAEEHGVSPEIIVEKYQSEFQQVWERFGISFDLFTSTHTKNHTDVVQDIFLKLYEKGFIYKDNMSIEDLRKWRSKLAALNNKYFNFNSNKFRSRESTRRVSAMS